MIRQYQELLMTPHLLHSQNSRCPSGPNSTAPDLTGASVRDAGSCHAPVFMSCVQDGFQELTHEQSEHLRAEVNAVKNSYRRNMVSYFLNTRPFHIIFFIHHYYWSPFVLFFLTNKCIY